MTDTNHAPISRRTLLAGLGTVGLVSASAGFGTTALFGDTESFDSTTLTAGTLDLAVEVTVVGVSDGFPGVQFSPTTVADGTAVSLTVDDIKPGDWFVTCWDLTVAGNPGYLRVSTTGLSNTEGANPESETDVDSPGDLGDALLTSVWRTFDATPPGTRADLSGLDGTTNRGAPSANGMAYELPDEDGTTASGATYTTLNEAVATYGSGVRVRDESGEPVVTEDGVTVSWYLLFELPASVGNEIQGDAVGFTLSFDAEQARSNPTPFSAETTAEED